MCWAFQSLPSNFNSSMEASITINCIGLQPSCGSLAIEEIALTSATGLLGTAAAVFSPAGLVISLSL